MDIILCTRFIQYIKHESRAIYQILQNGGSGVNRTETAFAEVGVDMALGQTLNVSAKTRVRGIITTAPKLN